MYSDRQLRVLMGAGVVAVVSAALGALSFANRPMAPDGDPVLGSAQLVMFETDDCRWCENFRRKTARVYAESDAASKAPIRFMSIEDGPPPKRYRLASFSKTPMLVMFDPYGRELGRIAKETMSAEDIETLVRRNLRRIAKL